MFCGSLSFAHVDSGDRDGGESSSSAPSTPRGSRSRSKKERRASKNPYSSRGLDTFYAVLAELEARRQRIVEKVGEKGSMVRFEYSDSQWVPIVVRIPTATELEEEKRKKKTKGVASKAAGDDRQRQDKKKLKRRASSCSPPASGPLSPPKSPQQQPIQHAPSTSTQEKKHPEPAAAVPSTASVAPPKADALRCWSRPRCRTAHVGPPCQGVRPLLLLAVILICLAAFGRTFAICCTCAWWYLAPSPTPACMQGSDGGRWWIKNKTTVDYGRRFSGKNLGSVPEGGTFASPQNQRPGQGGFMSPPKQRQVSGFMSPPKQRIKNFLSPPKSRQAQGVSPAKRRQSFNSRGGSLQLD